MKLTEGADATEIVWLLVAVAPLASLTVRVTVTEPVDE